MSITRNGTFNSVGDTIIPTNGFYEWKPTAGGKQPYFVQPTSAELFGLAGLWERWNQPDGQALDTFTIITTTANEAMRPIHDRMPVILQPADFETWLAKDFPSELVGLLLRPCAPDLLQMKPVPKAVGNISNDSPELITRQQSDLTL